MMKTPGVVAALLEVPPLHRWLSGAWLVLYLAWALIAPCFLERELAGWAVLWFIPTLAIGGAIGLLTIVWPKWYTVGLFAVCSLVPLAFGLGHFPK